MVGPYRLHPRRPSSAPPTSTSTGRAQQCEGTECISPQPTKLGY